jgi:hypothetical protein
MRKRHTTEERGANARRIDHPNERAGVGRRSSEAGYAYIMALALIMAVIIGSQVVLESLVTQGRRQREEETIWRGNQWARAIRLYYHKTGHYPQSIDDLENGLPDLHFLRESAIKDPMEPDDGSWRFIYVNSTGQIIGSVRYATLQQMALLDLNNGQLPGAQPTGLPGAVSAASLSSTFGQSSDAASSVTSSGGPGGSNGAGSQSSPGPGGSASVGGTSGQNPQGNAPSGDTSSQTPSGSTDNSANPGASPSSSSSEMSAFGQGQPASTFGSTGSNALGQNANPLAQLTQLQPTGPVDGPVIGAFLTGVGVPTAIDQNSIRIYHGGKKYKDWEFIWNPLEDQAQAIQQGLAVPSQPGQPGQAQPGQTQPGQTGPTQTPPGQVPNPFGNSMGDSSGSTSPQSSAPQPGQQSPP